MTLTHTLRLALLGTLLLSGCGGGGAEGTPAATMSSSATSSSAASSSSVASSSSSASSSSASSSSAASSSSSSGTPGTVQGSISGLNASGLTLTLNNTAATLSPPSGATSYQFQPLLASGTPYTVAITSQPTGLTCEISNGSGLVSGVTGNNVPLVCVPNGSAASDYNVIIGSPTNSSITISVLAAAGSSVYVEYGTTPSATGGYTSQSAAVTPDPSPTTGNPVAKVTLTGLGANTRYFYRVNVRPSGAASHVPGNEHSFWTQRAPGSTFTFAVQGDSHPERWNNNMFASDLYQLTMTEVAKRQPDLYFMLGDDFSYEGPIQNFKDAYCNQKGYNCGSNVATPGYLFTFANEGFFNPPGGAVAPYNTTPYGQNPAAFALYNSLASATLFTPALVGENVNNVTGYTPLTNANSTLGYGTYLEQRLRYLNRMGHSTSLFLVNGNHEQTAFANLGSIFNNAAVYAAAARNKFYVNPTPGNNTGVIGPGSFYTGDTDSFATGVNGFPGVPGDGLLRDYYAFTWGDALFVTIDPYWHSAFGPDTSLFDAIATNGEPTQYKTMGEAQYQWLKATLQNSTAKYKFIFQHHMLGYGRGAASMVTASEWGGQGSAGFNFTTQRSTWTKPIHQLLVDTMTPGGQTIVFTGHDHTFAREMIDGVVYQEVPNPADNSYWAYNCSAYAPASIAAFPSTWKKADGSAYGVYNPAYSIVRPDTGFLQVTVSPTGVRVDYIRSFRAIDISNNYNAAYDSLAGHANGETDFRYSLPANPAIDSAVSAYNYTCKGDAPPKTGTSPFIYGPQQK